MMDLLKAQSVCDMLAAENGIKMAVIRHFRDGAVMIMPEKQVHFSRVLYVSEQKEESPACNADDPRLGFNLFSV